MTYKRKEAAFEQLLFVVLCFHNMEAYKENILKRQKIIIKIWIILFGIILIGLLLMKTRENQEYTDFSKDYVLTEEIPGWMQFVYYSKEEWKEKVEKESFPKRMNYSELNWILQETGTSAYITYLEEKEKKIVSRKVWNEVYEQLLELLDTNGLVRKSNVAVLKIQKEELVTGEGILKNNLPKGFLEEQKAYSFYMIDKEVVGILGEAQGEALLKNVLVTEVTQESISFIYEKEQYILPITVEDTQVINQVCDIVWTEGVLSTVRLKKDTIEGNLVALNETTIEIDGYGEIKRDTRLPVYKTYGTVEEKELSDIVIANMKVKYVVAGGSVEAILLAEPAELKNIRVLLLGDTGGVTRENIRVTSDAPFMVSYGETNLSEAEKTVIVPGDLFTQGVTGVVKIAPGDGATLYFCNENNEKISLDYKGNLEIRNYGEGMVVVNELPIEEYLCAVVPSEMPASYEAEALKAQAVCARSYAYIQLLRGDYATYGAHVDDSTNYQVYNKQEKQDATTKAVLDTAGLVMTYQKNVAEAYYFSTSSGMTSNGDCWGLDTNDAYGYLKHFSLDESNPTPDYSSEDVFSQYITSEQKSGYDSAMPYYRWNAVCRFDVVEVGDKIKNIISERKSRVPENIQYLSLDLSAEADSMEGFGNLTDIQVESRSVSGVITQLLLRYEQGCVRVKNEYNMRIILGAGCQELVLSDGSKKEGSLVLPSAYLTFQKAEDGSYKIAGGGYGHGIGMSQNGANGMAQAGKTFQEILQSFFADIEITTVSW